MLYNINSLSQIAANFFLDYQDEFFKQIKEITKRREELCLGLKEIAGIKPYPSRANFIFFSCSFDSNRIYNKLVGRDHCEKSECAPLMPNCMRVTVGNKQENETFLKALKSVTPK